MKIFNNHLRKNEKPSDEKNEGLTLPIEGKENLRDKSKVKNVKKYIKQTGGTKPYVLMTPEKMNKVNKKKGKLTMNRKWLTFSIYD